MKGGAQRAAFWCIYLAWSFLPCIIAVLYFKSDILFFGSSLLGSIGPPCKKRRKKSTILRCFTCQFCTLCIWVFFYCFQSLTSLYIYLLNFEMFESACPCNDIVSHTFRIMVAVCTGNLCWEVLHSCKEHAATFQDVGKSAHELHSFISSTAIAKYRLDFPVDWMDSWRWEICENRLMTDARWMSTFGLWFFVAAGVDQNGREEWIWMGQGMEVGSVGSFQCSLKLGSHY